MADREPNLFQKVQKVQLCSGETPQVNRICEPERLQTFTDRFVEPDLGVRTFFQGHQVGPSSWHRPDPRRLRRRRPRPHTRPRTRQLMSVFQGNWCARFMKRYIG